MGIRDEIHLVGNDFSNAATIFFIAYLVFEVPNSKRAMCSLIFFSSPILIRRSDPPSKGPSCKMAWG